MNAILDFLEKAYQFIISQDIQAIANVLIAGISGTLIVSNKRKTLKMLKLESKGVAQENESKEIKKDIARIEQLIVALGSMFSLAFLNSPKLDAGTRQELARIAASIATAGKSKKNIKDIADTLEAVHDQAEQIINSPITEAVVDTTKSILEKLTEIKL